MRKYVLIRFLSRRLNWAMPYSVIGAFVLGGMALAGLMYFVLTLKRAPCPVATECFERGRRPK